MARTTYTLGLCKEQEIAAYSPLYSMGSGRQGRIRDIPSKRWHAGEQSREELTSYWYRRVFCHK